AKAASELMDAVDKANANVEVQKARAAVAVATGHPQDGESQLNQLLAGGKGGTDAFGTLLLGGGRLRGNRANRAEASFQRSLTLDQKLADAAFGLALCRDKAGDDKGTQSYLQKTLERSPTHFAALVMSARDKGEDSVQGIIQLHGTKGSPAEQAD